MASTSKLCERFPEVPADELIAGFVPPPQFAQVSLDSYIPDPSWPSQAEAVDRLRTLSAGFARDTASTGDSKAKRKLLGRKKSQKKASKSKGGAGARGVYLDGGFGVGKTHLLASLYSLASTDSIAPRAAFGSFVEYTNLVGALGFEHAVDVLSRFDLVCIDEFELDDPGDTVLISSLLSRLAERGVFLAATSNTLPDKLGEGRFAAEDFMREIQGLSSIFEVIRIDGKDYRHRDLEHVPRPATPDEVNEAAAAESATRDSFAELLDHLTQVHPSRYGAMVQGIDTVCLDDVFTLEDQSQALRLVALVDRLYDAQAIMMASGVPLDHVFSEDMLTGGYRKKYRRAISRLTAMAASE